MSDPVKFVGKIDDDVKNTFMENFDNGHTTQWRSGLDIVDKKVTVEEVLGNIALTDPSLKAKVQKVLSDGVSNEEMVLLNSLAETNALGSTVTSRLFVGHFDKQGRDASEPKNGHVDAEEVLNKLKLSEEEKLEWGFRLNNDSISHDEKRFVLAMEKLQEYRLMHPSSQPSVAQESTIEYADKALYDLKSANNPDLHTRSTRPSGAFIRNMPGQRDDNFVEVIAKEQQIGDNIEVNISATTPLAETGQSKDFVKVEAKATQTATGAIFDTLKVTHEFGSGDRNTTATVKDSNVALEYMLAMQEIMKNSLTKEEQALIARTQELIYNGVKDDNKLDSKEQAAVLKSIEAMKKEGGRGR